ncbi:MAG TPA: hypothetical protein VME66_05945 [Candidatus Acidoferrales bacterium]|nr:hypothetical protein [Candidatus Acidoferrales bacterium]
MNITIVGASNAFARGIADWAVAARHDITIVEDSLALLAKNGVPLEVVSKRPGHSNIGVTAERYLHVYSDRDAAAASALDALGG